MAGAWGQQRGLLATVGARIVSKCYSDLVLRIPWYVAWPLLVAGTVLPMIGPLLIGGFDSRRKITRVQAPILFIHGSADRTVPMRLGRLLFGSVPKLKYFWAISGAGHNDIVESAGPEYRKRLRSFYESLVDRPSE